MICMFGFTVEGFDQFTLDHPLVHLSSYVDDDSLTTEGETEIEVLDRMSKAAAAMFILFRDYLHVQLQAEKLTTFASSVPLARKLGKLLGRSGRNRNQ